METGGGFDSGSSMRKKNKKKYSHRRDSDSEYDTDDDSDGSLDNLCCSAFCERCCIPDKRSDDGGICYIEASKFASDWVRQVCIVLAGSLVFILSLQINELLKGSIEDNQLTHGISICFLSFGAVFMTLAVRAMEYQNKKVTQVFKYRRAKRRRAMRLGSPDTGAKLAYVLDPFR